MKEIISPASPLFSDHSQLITFYVGKNFYGIEVMHVQEVTGYPTIVNIPLAPSFILGMINLRGQIATALSLRILFGHLDETNTEQMSVVCKMDGNLFSLMVDSIGDVINAPPKEFETPPTTIPQKVKKMLKGIFKMKHALLSIID